MKVGDKIRAARLEAGFSQRQVAQMLGVTQQYVQAIERNKTDFKFTTFMSLAKILDKKPSWFCDENEKQDFSAASKTLDYVIKKTDFLTEAQVNHLREFFKGFKTRAKQEHEEVAGSDADDLTHQVHSPSNNKGSETANAAFGSEASRFGD